MKRQAPTSGLRSLSKRVGELGQQMAVAQVRRHGDDAREMDRWVMSDPEALELSLELFERTHSSPEDRPRLIPNPAFVGVSTQELVARFDALVQAGPKAKALMERLAPARPRENGHAT